MKEIKAFKCDFCQKVLTTKPNMKIHEKKCFKNPQTKSCVTCERMAFGNVIDGRLTTAHEEKLLNFEIEGTFDTVQGSDGEYYFTLKKEHRHLEENANVETICTGKQIVLKTLCTNCMFHKPKP